MSRNYDALTSIPVNSTMQDLDEIDDFSDQFDSQQNKRNVYNYEEEFNSDSEGEFDDEYDEYPINRHYETQHSNIKSFGEARSTSSRHKLANRTEDLREMTNITRINNSHKKTLKSFQEKYPLSVELPNMLQYSSSSNSLNSFSDNDGTHFEVTQHQYQHHQYHENRDQDIWANRKSMNKHDLKRIYQELNTIHNKLVNEYRNLQEREDELKKREEKLRQDEERLMKLVHLDAKVRFEEIRLKYDNEINNMKTELKEKFKDNKRLHEAFRSLKLSNDSLKHQLNEKSEKCIKQEKQLNSLNNRLVNLQKKSDFTKPCISIQHHLHQQQQQQQQQQKLKKNNALTKAFPQQTLVHNANILEAFAMLLEWLSQVHLKQTLNPNLPFSGDSNVIEKSCRLLPLLAELIISLNNSSISNTMAHSFKKYHLAFLEFIYWCILHCDSSFKNHKVNLSSTFRRIGEELYRSCDKTNEINSDTASSQFVALRLDDETSSKRSESTESVQSTCLFSLFLQSDNEKVRLLTYLIILRTLTQVDYIHNVFEMLRQELKNDTFKMIFLEYLGTWTLMKWCKLTNKSILGYSIDTYLQLSVDWDHVNKFFDSCSNESWFSHISSLLKSNIQNGENFALDLKILEKISVLLQKLSKNKSNRKYFEMFSLNKICNDMLKKYYYESEFLIMNLKSIIFNLNVQTGN